MKKWMIGCGAFVGLFLMLGACAALMSSVDTDKDNLQTDKKSISEKVDTPAMSTPEPAVKENDEVTYEEVVKIIGFEGTEMSSTEIGGIKTIMYSWQNDDGSNMNAMFQNNKLNTKAQFGLK
jgi:septal ring-binding cell division protein DamX